LGYDREPKTASTQVFRQVAAEKKLARQQLPYPQPGLMHAVARLILA
jgi:hypothetical protein